jgi:IS5 family transposase
MRFLEERGRAARSGRKDGDRTERNRTRGHLNGRQGQRCKIQRADAQRIAQLRVICAFLADIGDRVLYVMLLEVGIGVFERVRRPGLLREQQGENQEQIMKYSPHRHH